jgi:hypothetical protein
MKDLYYTLDDRMPDDWERVYILTDQGRSRPYSITTLKATKGSDG